MDLLPPITIFSDFSTIRCAVFRSLLGCAQNPGHQSNIMMKNTVFCKNFGAKNLKIQVKCDVHPEFRDVCVKTGLYYGNIGHLEHSCAKNPEN